MHKLMGTPIDKKNIGLSKLLYGLRQELDIYYVIADNADTIKQSGLGKIFFGYIQKLAMDSIILNICKIYEKDSLNSIDGVFRELDTKSPKALDGSKLEGFIKKYGGPSNIGSPISALHSTIKGFRKRYKSHLECFETFRHKMVAHSEYDFNKDKLPSKDVMEKLFLFGADFYELVSESFISDTSVQVIPFDLKAGRTVKSSLKRLFKELGFEDIKTGM